MLIDLDYFYAQCEERRDQTLKNKPVIVCVYSGRTDESGVVSTSNYIARQHGVKSGISIFLAKNRLEGVDAKFLPMDHSFYKKVSNNIMQILKSYSDKFEQMGIDEAYLDVTLKTQGSFERATNLAREIKKEIAFRENLTSSVGIGPNKIVAKIAAGVEKPGGLTVVKPERVKTFLSPLMVNRLPGVGKKTTKKMEALGIRTIGELARYDLQKLSETFGRNLGIYFHNASMGQYNNPVQVKGRTVSISRIATLKENTQDFEIIIDKVTVLSKEVHEALVKSSLRFKTISAIAIMKDMSIRSRTKTLENPTDHLDTINTISRDLFKRFLEETEDDLRRVGVKLAGLTKRTNEQKNLKDFFM